MNRKILLNFLAFLPPLLVPYRGLALQFCETAATEADCVEKVNAELLQDASVAKLASSKEAEMAIKNLTEKPRNEAARELLAKVAPEIAALPGASAALDDFLGRLRIGVASEGPDDMQALAFDFTNFLDFLGLTTTQGYKLQAVARDPTLFEALSTQLSEENRDKRTKGLNAFDDVLVTVAYSPSTTRLGNNLGANQILIDELFRRVLAQSEPLAAAATQAKEHREDLKALLRDDFPAAFSDQDELLAFDKIDDKLRRQQYREAVERAAVAEANRLTSISKSLKEMEFFKIADLVANQPQLVIKATKTVRDELAGPEEATLKVTYEQGFVNVNSLRRAFAACRPGELKSCYSAFLTKSRAARAKEQNRLTFSLDWTERQDYDATTDGASVDLPGRERWTVSASFGRNLRVDVNGKFTSRFDLTGSWEDWSDDPVHQDRGLANLSFTQKVTDDFSLVLGAVWASEPEFRGEVDEQVSARFGLTYRFLDKEGKEIMRGN